MDPMNAVNTNQAFEENLRQYPGERYPKKKKEWAVDVHDSIITICKMHPSQRPPMVRPEDDNELGAQDVEAFIKNLVENGQPVVKAQGLGKVRDCAVSALALSFPTSSLGQMFKGLVTQIPPFV